MDKRPLTDRYTVAPQIQPEDVAAIAAAGYTTLINNRPCGEIPPSHRADVMAQAADAAGLDYVVLPITHEALGPDLAARQRAAIDASAGPVFAYCASGTRCTIVWAISEVAQTPVEDVIATAAQQGYDLGPLRAQLTSIAES